MIFLVFEEKTVKLKDGRTCVLRSARPTDAEALLNYLKITAGETRFLAREPEEITMTLENEIRFLESRESSPDELMLVAVVDDEIAGNCGLLSMGHHLRMRHRCGVAIALYQKFCGLGLGTLMLETVLTVAKDLGYEQAELEVVAGNDRARHVYEKLGFIPFGTHPNALKYKDDTYADNILMAKKL